MDPDALPRKLLCARSASSTAKGITHQYHQVLSSNLNLPGPPSAHPGRLLLKSTWALLHTSHSLKSATITMLANAPSSLSQPPIGRSPLGILSSPVWITLEFVSWLDVMDWKLMLLVSAAELPMLSQGIPHASSATRESLRMLHTSCLHALSLIRRGWSCTQSPPHPLYVPKSRTQEFTYKISWRWWLARAGLITSTPKILHSLSEQAQGSQNFPRSILSLVLLILGQLSWGGGKKEEEEEED